MEVQVLERRENPLLKRVEVSFKVVHPAEPTPTRDALRAELAKALKATKDVVIVDGAASSFGRFETRGYAKVYKTKEAALEIERKHILVRNGLAQAEKKEKAAPKAAPAKRETKRPTAASKAEEKAVAAAPAPKEEKKAPPPAKTPAPAKKEEKTEAKK